MGQEITFKCLKCGNMVKICEGVGEIWHTLNKEMFYPPKYYDDLNFYHILDKKIIEEVHIFIEKSDNIDIIDAAYSVYRCKKCKKIESKLYFRIENSNNKVYCPIYVCECGGDFERLEFDEEKHIFCNKCGSEMTQTNVVFWD